MAVYKCKVINELGKERSVVVEAIDEESLKAKVKLDSLHLVSFKEVKEKKPSEFFSMSFSVKRSEVVLFLRQFAVMINSTIPISDSLNVLRDLGYSSAFRDVVDTVYKDVISGNLLSKALSKHPTVFPDFFIQMVEIGELSGSLDTVLTNMADYFENDERIKKKARSSLVYPILLIVMIFAVVIFMAVFIMPQFEEMFNEFGGNIPGFTKLVLAISHFISDYIIYIFALLFVLAASIWLFRKTKAGKKVFDWMGLNLPVIGKINKATVTARFTKAFSILLKSGMNITDCMENLVNILGNEVYSKKFEFAIEEVKRGRYIASSLDKTGIFSKMVIEMISVGEKSGNLEEVLDTNSKFFDEQVDNTITKSVALLEPAIIISLGLVVATVLLSVYIPMIQLMNQI